MDEFNLDFCSNNRSRENVDDVVVKIINKSPFSLRLYQETVVVVVVVGDEGDASVVVSPGLYGS